MKSHSDLARGLIQKAHNDLRMAEIGLEHKAPLDTVSFHIQQTAEKLLKALLSFHGINYPRTHDLQALLDLAIPQFPVLLPFRERFLGLTSYAVGIRYDMNFYPEPGEVLSALQTVKEFQKVIFDLVPLSINP